MIRFAKRLMLAAILAAFVCPVLPADSVHAAQKAASKTQEIVARVNGNEITKERLDIAVNNLMPTVSYHSSVSDKRMKQIRQKALDNIINDELIYKYARDNKLDDVKDKDLDEEVAKIKKRLPKGEKLETVLKRSNMTVADLKEDFRKQLTVAQVSKKKNEEFVKKAQDTVNEAFLKDYYQKNMDKFKEPEQIHLRSILIKADPSGGQKVWTESLKKAREVVKLAKAGEDFGKLAQKHSEDPNAKNGGDMGWAHKGSLFAEIDDAASNMKVGDVSEPVATIYGYHVLKLEGKKAPVQRKFEELNKEKLEKELEAKEYKKLWDGWLDDLRKASKVEILGKK